MRRSFLFPRLPARYGHYLFAVIQSALTTAIASAVATVQVLGLKLAVLPVWLLAWLIAWLTVIPIVLVAAPFIRRIVLAATVLPIDE